MATTPSKTQTAPSEDSPESVKSDVPEVSAEDIKKVKEDFRLSKMTAEDAYLAYLREEIDETQLRAIVASTGNHKFSALKNNLERPDNAYTRQIPEDLYDDPSVKVTSVEDRLKVVEERDKEAEKARKEAEKEEKSE